MNKERFLTELREYLSVLERQEQDDICAEYAQHIDMKIQKGLSEEEAIRDFGSVEHLAAEILEAYHVNPEFRRQGFSFKLPKLKTSASRGSIAVRANPGTELSGNQDDSAQEAESVIKRVGSRLKNAMTGTVHGIGRAFHWIGVKCRAFGSWIMKPFRGRRNKAGDEAQERAPRAERTKEMGGYAGRFFRRVGRGIVISWKCLVGFCIFWLKFMWNAAWLLFALMCAFMAMLALSGVGMIVVFLVQGYPFIGLFLISLGGLLCFGALAYGAFGMLIKQKKNDGDDVEGDSRREEAAEGFDAGRKESAGDGCNSGKDEEVTVIGNNGREEELAETGEGRREEEVTATGGSRQEAPENSFDNRQGGMVSESGREVLV